MIFELTQDFHDALASMPREHPKHRMLELLEEAIRRDIHFIARRPTTLFQCLWNTCWWFDCQEAGAGQERHRGEICSWMEAARRNKVLGTGCRWLRSHLPKAPPLGGPQMAVYSGHRDAVECIVFSHDGGKIASASADNTVRLWDAASGCQRLILEGFEAIPTCADFSPDGMHVATGTAWPDNTVCIWDAMSGRRLLTLRGHAQRVTSVAYAPNGRWLASGSYDRTVRIWNAASGQEQFCVGRDGYEEIFSVAWSPDGRYFAAASGNLEGSENMVRVWDKDGREVRSLPGAGRGHWVQSIDFSPDGQCIVVGSKAGAVIVWNVRSASARILQEYGSPVYAVAWSPDGQLIASGMEDATVHVWDAKSDTPQLRFCGHNGSVLSVRFSPDGLRLATGSQDRTIRIWNPRHTADLRKAGQQERATGDSTHLLVQFWSGFEMGQETLTAVAFSPNGLQLVTGYSDGIVSVWDSSLGLRVWKGMHRGYGEDDSAELSTVLSRGRSRSSLGRRHIVCAFYTPDGRRIVTGSRDLTVRVWDAATGAEMHCHRAVDAVLYLPYGPAPSLLNAVVCSADGKHIAAGGGWAGGNSHGTIRIWELETGTEILHLQPAGVIWCLAYSPDAQRLAAGTGDGEVLIIDGQTGAEDRLLHVGQGPVYSVAWSRDGQVIAVGSHKGTVRLWDAGSGADLVVLSGHTNCIRGVAFTSDGRRIISASDDNTTRIWEAGTGRCVEVIEGVVDIGAMAVFGSSSCPLLAITKEGETAIRCETGRREVAWLPASLEKIATHPSAWTWAGSTGDCLHVVTLEKEQYL